MQKIVLNVIPDGVYPRVYVNQFDIGRQFEITFKEDIVPFNMPSGVTVKINGRKADNHVFEYTESDKYDETHYVITKSGSGTYFTVVIATTEQMTAAAGDAEVQLTYKGSANRVQGTLNFILAVQERPASVGDPSESDLPDVVRSINGIGPDADGDVVIGAGAFGIGADNISSVEATRTMTSNHAAGSYVYVAADDQRYKVGANALNAGSTLTPGTNATACKVDQDIEQLTSDLANKIKYNRLDKLYATQAANAWEDTGLSFTVPNEHFYICHVGTNWQMGKPIGLGVALQGSLIYRFNPNDGISVLDTPAYFLSAGTYNVYAMREAASETQNTYYLYYLDIMP